MARSYKRRPVVGVSAATSEKQDKRRDSRRRRRRLWRILSRSVAASEAEGPVIAEPRRSGAVMFAKDGKRWLAAGTSPRVLRRLRK
ncbi:hypothetical protein [Nannocystis pusilla]|uniref:hypothetical protein n=1 Tax=Nannocystis pusilla TaxID=889268 RepID=UPI003B7FFBC8